MTSKCRWGNAFWKTIEGLGSYRHVFADPESGQVAMMGTMREAGAALLMSVRLQIELGRITEIESIYYRQGKAGPRESQRSMFPAISLKKCGLNRFPRRNG